MRTSARQGQAPCGRIAQTRARSGFGRLCSGVALAAALLSAGLCLHTPALAADNYDDVTSTLTGDWTNYGTVTTSGDNVPGMRAASGQTSTNAVSGVLSTSGDRSYGIYASGGTAYNYGSISTSGDLAHGILVTAGTAYNYGDISTTGTDAYGLHAFNSTAYNYGSISTADAYGLVADSSTIYNYGTISTTGLSDYGLYASGSDVYNYGTVTTTGGNSSAIYAEAGSTVYNYGAIATLSDFARGISASSSVVYNYGSISTAGDNAAGISSTSTVYNYGDILTTGSTAHGLIVNGGTAYNYGTISTTGFNAYGISIDSGTVYNSGVVSASDGIAIYCLNGTVHLQTGTSLAGAVDGAGGTTHLFLDGSGTVDFDISGAWTDLTKTGDGTWTLAQDISGTVSALNLEGGTLALASGVSLNISGDYTQSAGTTLSLVLDGATTPLTATGTASLDGTLDVDVSAAAVGTTSTLLNATGGVSGTFARYESANPNFSLTNLTYGADTVTVTSAFTPQWDAPSLASLSSLGSTQAFVDVAQSRSLALLTDNGSRNRDREIMVASAGSLSGLLNPREEPTWGLYLQPVYSEVSRSRHSSGEGYDSQLFGLEAGIDRTFGSHWVLGAMAGIGTAHIDFTGSDFVSDDDEDQTLYTVGAYAGYSLGDWLFSDTLSLTYVDQDSDRNAGLSQTASADYDSWLTRNQLLAMYRWRPSEAWEIAPRAGLDVTYLHRGGFSETGATNAVSYDDLDKVFADASLGLRATGHLGTVRGAEVSPYVGGGVIHALGSGDITVRQYLSTASAQVTTENDADRLTSECGVTFGQGSTSFTLGYNGEYGETTDSHAVFGMLRMEF